PARCFSTATEIYPLRFSSSLPMGGAMRESGITDAMSDIQKGIIPMWRCPFSGDSLGPRMLCCSSGSSDAHAGQREPSNCVRLHWLFSTRQAHLLHPQGLFLHSTCVRFLFLYHYGCPNGLCRPPGNWCLFAKDDVPLMT